VSHEFFHCWNVERIRPADLQPYNFLKANMSEGLWFAEGFTSYYTSLVLCRAGLRSQEDYINSLTGTFNYVWNSNGRNFFNPVEMSQQATFVDAAKSVDPVNRDNTFISYYSYGSALGLALDLALREKNLNLDDYMKMVWFTYGKEEISYKVEDLHKVLNDYAGEDFGDEFFNNYIYKSGMPNMKRLFENVGVSLSQDSTAAWFGRPISAGKIARNTLIGSPAYKAGLENGDKIIKFGEYSVNDKTDFDSLLSNFNPDDSIKVTFERYGQSHITTVTLANNPRYEIKLLEAIGLQPTEQQKTARDLWLKAK